MCKLNGKKYIYAYWNEPDFTMHQKGCYHKELKKVLIRLEKMVQKLCSELKDTLVIVTADHGHIDSKGAALEDYPELLRCLIRLPSIEPRALNFFVKKDMEQQFEDIFNKEFGSKFLLLSREEKEFFIGAHAGLTEDEMIIPLITIEK